MRNSLSNDVADFLPDFGAQVNHSQVVLSTDIAAKVIVNQLSSYTSAINQSQISYNPLTRNSNSFAFQAVQNITGARPSSAAFAPGSTTLLGVKRR